MAHRCGCAPFPLEQAERHHIEQSYLSFSPQVRLRAIDDERFVLTIKGKAEESESPLVRGEREFAISRDAFLELRENAEGRVLIKTRYIIPEERMCGDSGEAGFSTGRVFEIDVFEGDYAGLAVAEMEFGNVEDAEAYPTPGWARADVSDDPRYRNVVMAQAPEPAIV